MIFEGVLITKIKSEKSIEIKNMKNALKITWTNQIQPRHHLLPQDNALTHVFQFQAPMFYSRFLPYFSTKINDSNHKSKFKLSTTSCFLQNSKWSIIEVEIRARNLRKSLNHEKPEVHQITYASKSNKFIHQM